MDKIIAFTMFLLVGFTIMFGVQLYTLIRLSTLFRFAFVWRMMIPPMLIVLLFPAVMIIGRVWWNPFMQAAYIAISVYFGVVFTLFFFAFLHHIASRFISLPEKPSQIVFIVLSASVVIASLVNAALVRVKTVEISSPKIETNFRIAQLTDIHLGPIAGKSYMKRLVEKTNERAPDAVFITGDLLDRPGKLNYETVKSINDFNAPVYFIMGNHEIYTGIEFVSDLLSRTKTKILRDEKSSINDFIDLYGIDDPGHFSFEGFERRLGGLKPQSDKFNILLTHRPVSFKRYGDYEFDLQIAGHVHAGQIFPFNLFVWIAYSTYKGLYESEGRYIYVSPGTGTWGPPMRFGSFNEITIIDIIGGK